MKSVFLAVGSYNIVHEGRIPVLLHPLSVPGTLSLNLLRTPVNARARFWLQGRRGGALTPFSRKFLQAEGEGSVVKAWETGPSCFSELCKKWGGCIVGCCLSSFRWSHNLNISGGTEIWFPHCSLLPTLSSWQGCQQMHPEMDLKEKEDRNGSFLPACLPFFFIFLFPFWSIKKKKKIRTLCFRTRRVAL